MMKRAKLSFSIIGILLVVYVLQQLGALNGLANGIGQMPIWIMAVIAGIIVSAWQFLKNSGAEEEVDMKLIEDQGKIYIHRMEEERDRRRKQKTSEDVE